MKKLSQTTLFSVLVMVLSFAAFPPLYTTAENLIVPVVIDPIFITPLTATNVAGTGSVQAASGAFSGTTNSTSPTTGTVTVGNGTAATTVGIGGGNVNAGNSVSAPSLPVPCESYGMSPSASASANATALQACLNSGAGIVSLTNGGVYMDGATVTIPSNTTFRCGRGVTLRASLGGSFTEYFAGLLTNNNHSSGNSNIKVVGDCTLDQNNTAGATGANYSNPLYFENVNNLYIGDGITAMQGFRGINAFKITNSIIRDFTYNIGANLANDSVIFVGGQSSNDIIEKIYGTSSDDIVALNSQDVSTQTTVNSIGNISNIKISDIYANSSYQGNAVVLFPANWNSTDSNAGIPPTISSIVNVGTASLGAYASGTTYAVGNIVTANNNYYYSLVSSNTGHAPPSVTTATAYWYNLGSAPQALITTSVAHNMSPGSHFSITGYSPSGYNTVSGTNASNGYGTVLTTPTSTTFAYAIPSSLGSISGVPTLIISYDMSNIVVDGVYSNIYGNSLFNITGYSATSSTYGTASNIKVYRLNGTTTNGVPVIVTNFATIFNLLVSDWSPKSTPGAVQLFSMANSSYLAESAIIDKLTTPTYDSMPESSSGLFGLTAYDSFTISNSVLKMATNYVSAIVGDTATSALSFNMNNVQILGTGTKNIIMYWGSSSTPPKHMAFTDVSFSNIDRFMHMPQGTSTTTIDITNLRGDGCAEAGMTMSPSTGTFKINLNNVSLTNMSAGFIKATPSSTGTIAVNVGNFNSNKANPNSLLDSASSIGSGAITVTGSQAIVDVSTISRNSGSIITHYGTSETGISNGDLLFCDSAGAVGVNGSNVWHAMKSPILVTY